MPIYRFGSRYSRWDGTQQIGPLSADDLMRAMSDDLMQDGDVNRALQRLFRWGFQRPDGENVPGCRGSCSACANAARSNSSATTCSRCSATSRSASSRSSPPSARASRRVSTRRSPGNRVRRR